MARARMQYLSDAEKETIDQRTRDVLEQTGIGCPSDKALDLLEHAGARVDRAAGTARIPRQLVEECLQTIPREALLAARDPRHDVLLAEDQPLACTTDGQCFLVADDLSGEVRDATLEDVRTFIRLYDAMPELDYLWNTLATREVDPAIQGLEIDIVTLESTAKHIQSGSPRGPDGVPPLIEVLEAVAGAPLAERPIYSLVYDTIAPLQQERDMLEVSMELVKHGVPICVLPMPLMGQTGPMSVFGTAIVTMAEILSTAVILELAHPGCVVISGPAPAVSDLRSGVMLAGAAEVGLLQLVTLEMSRHYGLPTLGVGTTDARSADYQAAAEAMLTSMAVASVGADALLMPGLLDSDKTASLAKVVLDCEAIGALKRFMREEPANDETCLVADIFEVGIGGHYLSQRSTRHLGRRGAVWQPRVFQRGPHDAAPLSLLEKAVEAAKETLATHEVPPIPDDVRSDVRRILQKHAREKGARVTSVM